MGFLSIILKIISIRLISKFEAIKNERGGPKTIQQDSAIQKSAKTKMANFLFLVKDLSPNAMLFIFFYTTI